METVVGGDNMADQENTAKILKEIQGLNENLGTVRSRETNFLF